MPTHQRKQFQRWAAIHSLFPLKTATRYRTYQLQTIYNIEADLNHHRQEFKARRLMNNMEKHSGLVDEQYCRRGGKLDITTLTALTLETLTLQWPKAVLTDCNAMTCYNRIIPAITFSESHKMGLPESI
eukprot:11085752-Ditylum_brightwellii.AAC.1